MRGRRRVPAGAALGGGLVLAALALGGPAAGQGADYGFMPRGGKSLLLEALGAPAPVAALRAILEARRSEAEWRAYLAAGEGRPAALAGLGPREQATLAAYLAVNAPVPAALLAEAAGTGRWRETLPADGRELAVRHCQSCHGLFSGYLTHTRDVQGWLGTFETPFHREIAMGERERETFARYSAINMPVPVERVPPELRY